MPTLVHVVEADPASPTAIVHLLQACGYQTKAYGSANEILGKITDHECPGCIVIEIHASVADAPDLFDRLTKAGSDLPVIFLAGHSDVRAGVRAIKAGAEDFFTKPVEREEFIGAIDRAIARHRLTTERESWARRVTARLQRLTQRERQVFELVVRGKMNKQVAFEIGTTERTVKAHRHKVMEKMQVRSVVELVSCAERFGLSTGPV